MASAEQPQESTTELGAFGRVVGALVSPRSTFDSIARKPGWLLPLILLITINIVVAFTFTHRIGWRTIMEQQLAKSSRYAQMTPAQQQQVLDRQLRIAPVLGYVGGTVGSVIIMLIIAGLFLGAFNVVFGSGIKFSQSFGITTHAFMPQIVKGILGLVILWVRPPEGINIQNLVMSNVGAFLPSSIPSWLQTLTTSLDLFAFWTLALLAIGYAAASSSRKLKFGSALAVVIVLWLIYVVAAVGMSAAFLS
jgi:hypothetical protein